MSLNPPYNLTAVNPTTAQNSPSHSGEHNETKRALDDIVTELGDDPSGAYASTELRLDAVDTSIQGIYSTLASDWEVIKIAGNTVTGTTATDDNDFSADVLGGGMFYKVEAFLIYNGPSVTGADIGFRWEIIAGAGLCEAHMNFSYFDITETLSANTNVFVDDGPMQVGVYPAGSLLEGSPEADRRIIQLTGVIFAGVGVTNARFAITSNENSGTGDGVTIAPNSLLRIHPISGGVVT